MAKAEVTQSGTEMVLNTAAEWTSRNPHWSGVGRFSFLKDRTVDGIPWVIFGRGGRHFTLANWKTLHGIQGPFPDTSLYLPTHIYYP
jgi:hypothetical protein